MTRALVEDLPSPIPFGSMLPDVYQHFDENILKFTSALDEVIAPVWLALDCFDAYIDPETAPGDFIDMLADWVGLPLDRNWREDQMRRLVSSAVELYRWRGTVQGISKLVEAYAGVTPTITETGGTVISTEPGGRPPGSPKPSVHIQVRLPSKHSEDLARLTRLIAAGVPAHVAVNVEIVRS